MILILQRVCRHDVLNCLHKLLPSSYYYSLTCFIYFLFGKYEREWSHCARLELVTLSPYNAEFSEVFFLSGKRIDKQKYIANLYAVNKLNFSRYDNSRKSLHFLTVQLVVHVPYIISNNVFQRILKATLLIFKKSMFEKYML